MPEYIPNRQGNRLCDPPANCIYCTNPGVTREHVIPQGLGARDFIPDASCESCQVKTRAFEGAVQRDMVWAARVRHGMRGQKRKPPEKLEVVPIARDGTDLAPIALPARAIPISGALIRFRRPGLFVARSPVETEQIATEIFLDRRVADEFLAAGHEGMAVNANPWAFIRMLSKIAHTQAVADFGLDGFDAWVVHHIHGEGRDRWSWLVGEAPGDRPPKEQRHHWVRVVPCFFKGEPLLIAHIRLFANLNGPVYEVVVGRLKDAPAAGLPAAPA